MRMWVVSFVIFLVTAFAQTTKNCIGTQGTLLSLCCDALHL